MYTLEHTLLSIAGLICFFTIFFIPGKDAAKAWLIFFLTQFFSWILGLIVVELGLLEYPVRELAKANSTSFLFEYMLFPVMTIFFVLKYPTQKPLLLRLLRYIFVVSAFTFVELIVERYTRIIEYHSWKWYWTWLSVAFIMYIVMVIYRWYFRIKMKNIFSL